MVKMQLKPKKFWRQIICGIMDVLEDFTLSHVANNNHCKALSLYESRGLLALYKLCVK